MRRSERINEMIVVTLAAIGGLVMVEACFPGCDDPSRNIYTGPPSRVEPTPEQPQGFGMSAPEQSPPELASHRHTHFVSNGEGYANMPGVRISWAGNTNDGADTLDVTNALIVRMEWEQRQPGFASDQNAQALFHLMQARQLLEGKTITTADGLPIVE